MDANERQELIRQARQKCRIMSESEMKNAINFSIELLDISIKGLQDIENPNKDERRLLKRLKIAVYELNNVRPHSL